MSNMIHCYGELKKECGADWENVKDPFELFVWKKELAIFLSQAMQAEKWLRDKRQVDWGAFASRGGYDEFCNFFTELGLEEEKKELQQGKEYVFASIEID